MIKLLRHFEWSRSTYSTILSGLSFILSRFIVQDMRLSCILSRFVVQKMRLYCILSRFIVQKMRLYCILSRFIVQDMRLSSILSRFIVQKMSLYCIFSRFIIIIIIIKKGRQCKAGTERLTAYQTEDPNPTTPTHKMKEEKWKRVGDKKWASS